MARSNKKDRIYAAIQKHFYNRNPELKKALETFMANQLLSISMGDVNEDEYVKEHGGEA